MEKVCQEAAAGLVTKSEAEIEYGCKQAPLPTKGDDVVNRNGIVDHCVGKTGNQMFLNSEGHLLNCSTTEKRKDADKSILLHSDRVANSGLNALTKYDHGACCSDAVGGSELKIKDTNNYDADRNLGVSFKGIKENFTNESKSNEASTSKLFSRLVIKDNDEDREIDFIQYQSEDQLPDLVALITVELSEPYSVYTYRYFLHNWPHLSHLAYLDNQCVGAIVCKLDIHRKNILRGYIAMLVVHKSYRRWKIGSSLVKKAVKKMIEHGCEEVVLETEVTNKAALKLYENLGFVRDKRLLRYYLNGVDAWRLKLWLK